MVEAERVTGRIHHGRDVTVSPRPRRGDNFRQHLLDYTANSRWYVSLVGIVTSFGAGGELGVGMPSQARVTTQYQEYPWYVLRLL